MMKRKLTGLAVALFALAMIFAGCQPSVVIGGDGSDGGTYTCGDCGTVYNSRKDALLCGKTASCPGYIQVCINCGTGYTKKKADSCAKKEGCPEWRIECPNCKTKYKTTSEKDNCEEKYGCPKFVPVPEIFVKVAGGSVIGNSKYGGGVFINGRTVTIKDFWISDHEVTKLEYEKYCYTSKIEETNVPVTNVSWYDALVYCNKRSIAEGLTPCYSIKGSTDPSKWGTTPSSSNSDWDKATCNFDANGYRLPTEVEWEYAARGGGAMSTKKYAGSDIIYDVAWYWGNSNNVHKVKGKSPVSEDMKIYDMSGNVREWCWDWNSTISDTTPSTGASSGTSRVVRGGSYSDTYYDSGCIVSYRDFGCSLGPYRSSDILGFRVVRSSLN